MLKKPLILIGLDGVSWPFLNILLKRVSFSNITRFLNSIQKGELVSTIPPMTAVSWTSIFTGTNPGKHGIFGFLKFKEGVPIGLNTVYDVKIPRLWELLDRFNYKQLIINVPLSAPFRAFKGVGIPDWLSLSQKFFISKDIDKECLNVLRREKQVLLTSSGINWWFFQKNKSALIEDMLSELELKISAYIELLECNSWDSFIIVISETDWLQHLVSIDLLLSNKKYFNYVVLLFSKLDRLLRKIYEIYGTEAVYVLVSDHGFQTYNYLISLNNLLLSHNLLVTDSLTRLFSNKSINTVINMLIALATKILRISKLQGASKIRISRRKIKYSNSIAYFPEDISGMGIRINYSFIKSRKMDIMAVRNYLIKILNNFNKKYGFPLAIISPRDEIYWGSNISRAPDIVILPNMKKGYWVTSNPFSKVLTNAHSFNHNMLGIYGIFNYNNKINFKVKRILSYEILQLILYSLNLPVPKFIDGRKIYDLIDVQDTKVNYDSYLKVLIKYKFK